MINITLLAVGKLGEPYLREASREYEKRLGAFCKLRIAEVAEFRLPPNPSPAQIDRAIQEEGRGILQKIPKNACTAALCIEGKSLSSEELAAGLRHRSLETGHIALVIGGSHGLSDPVKQRADLALSMSRMTFPHQLARIMVLEQLYRAFSISAGGKYHK